MNYQIINQDSASYLATLPDNSIDAVVTDPPYGIDFLGKAWDSNTGEPEIYRQCLRVLKPGGHILAFSAARTYHHLAMSIEQAGFEIRDQIMWIYGSGFPKSQDVGRQLHKKHNGRPDKQRYDKNIMIPEGSNYRHPENGKLYRVLPDINGGGLARSHEGQPYGIVFEEIIQVDNPWTGWGTCLKPAHEPICMARKPMRNSVAQNVQEWGVGAINVDATRIPTDDVMISSAGNADTFYKYNPENNLDGPGTGSKINTDVAKWTQAKGGRFPANIIHDGSDDVMCMFPSTEVKNKPPRTYTNKTGFREGYVNGVAPDKEIEHTIYNDGGSAARFFYCAKVNKTERNTGYGTHELGNNHPTVKPVDLMRYLIRLVTPPGGTVLDPFCGSGSTGMAAVELGHTFIGIEREASYAKIAHTRIAAWHKQHNPLDPELFETAA